MNLILKYKYYIIAGILSIFILSLVFTYLQIGTDRIGDWIFDKKIEKIEKHNKTLELSNEELRKENIKLSAEKMELEAFIKVLESEEAKYPSRIEKEKEKLKTGLQELDKTEIEAQKYTEPYERCLRINTMTKYKLNCEEYRK